MWNFGACQELYENSLLDPENPELGIPVNDLYIFFRNVFQQTGYRLFDSQEAAGPG